MSELNFPLVCVHSSYRIRPNYPYKPTIRQFRSFQITASVLFVYVFIMFIEAYVVGTHLTLRNKPIQIY